MPADDPGGDVDMLAFTRGRAAARRGMHCAVLALALISSIATSRAQATDHVRVAAVEPSSTTSDGIDPVRPAPHLEPFGAVTSPAIAGGVTAKWRQVERDMAAEAKVFERCRREPETCPPAARRFLAIVEEGRAHQGRARLGLVNRAINLAIRPMSDMAQHGVPDLWSTALATFTSGAGDCEDYAIAKYAALREAGSDPADLRIVIVRDDASREDHAVLAARLDARWLILDNRRFAMLGADELPNYRPLFALDHNGVRSVPAMATAPAIAPVANMDTSQAGHSAAPLLL